MNDVEGKGRGKGRQARREKERGNDGWKWEVNFSSQLEYIRFFFPGVFISKMSVQR